MGSGMASATVKISHKVLPSLVFRAFSASESVDNEIPKDIWAVCEKRMHYWIIAHGG